MENFRQYRENILNLIQHFGYFLLKWLIIFVVFIFMDFIK